MGSSRLWRRGGDAKEFVFLFLLALEGALKLGEGRGDEEVRQRSEMEEITRTILTRGEEVGRPRRHCYRIYNT